MNEKKDDNSNTEPRQDTDEVYDGSSKLNQTKPNFFRRFTNIFTQDNIDTEGQNETQTNSDVRENEENSDQQKGTEKILVDSFYQHEISAEDEQMMREENHYLGSVGDIIANRYEIRGQVGLGTFGRVLDCYDRNRKENVAIKIIRNKPKYTKLAQIEVEILRDIQKNPIASARCVQLLKFFNFQGHACIVTEKLGPSLYDFIKANQYAPLPLWFVHGVAKQLIEAVQGLHQMSLIHTDLKPENILMINSEIVSERCPTGGQVKIPRTAAIKVIDFGGAYYESERDQSLINTRQYRGPEVILQLDWRTESDLWSVGCIIAEMYDGDQLFATHSNLEHLCLIEKVVGSFPLEMLQQSKVSSKYFDSSGKCLTRKLPSSQRDFVARTKPVEEFVEDSDKHTGILELLKGLLTIQPMNRFSAEIALQSNFFSFSNF